MSRESELLLGQVAIRPIIQAWSVTIKLDYIFN